MKQPDFNPIARPYRYFEYLTLGPILQRTRTHFLPQLLDRRQALLLGDGDGRFLARLLAANPALHADAVDTSAAMLNLLRQRCRPYAVRLETHHHDARFYTPARQPDLITTHFFLDCLTQPELNALVSSLGRDALPGTLWLLSDFRIPTGPMRLPARLYIRTLYLAFRLLTGLRTTRLPEHEAALRQTGFTRTHHRLKLFGLLTTELWKKEQA